MFVLTKKGLEKVLKKMDIDKVWGEIDNEGIIYMLKNAIYVWNKIGLVMSVIIIKSTQYISVRKCNFLGWELMAGKIKAGEENDFFDFYKYQTIDEYNGWNIKRKSDNGMEYLKTLVDKIKGNGV